MAGLQATTEAPTDRVLGYDLTAEQCHRLFPKNPSADFVYLRDRALAIVHHLAAALPGRKKEAVKAQFDQALAKLPSSQDGHQPLRLDLQIVDPHTNLDAVVDFAVVHPSVPAWRHA